VSAARDPLINDDFSEKFLALIFLGDSDPAPTYPPGYPPLYPALCSKSTNLPGAGVSVNP